MKHPRAPAHAFGCQVNLPLPVPVLLFWILSLPLPLPFNTKRPFISQHICTLPCMPFVPGPLKRIVLSKHFCRLLSNTHITSRAFGQGALLAKLDRIQLDLAHRVHEKWQALLDLELQNTVAEAIMGLGQSQLVAMEGSGNKLEYAIKGAVPKPGSIALLSDPGERKSRICEVTRASVRKQWEKARRPRKCCTLVRA
jgi:hypothetical protein